MSADFKTLFVHDSAIADITPEIDYVVKGGAASTTYQQFNATSSSNSSLTFSIQLPSENIVMGRDAMIESQVNFSIKIGSATAPVVVGATNPNVLAWGQDTAFHAFPVSSNMNTANVQINNTSTSINLKDVLPLLLRLNDSRELYKYNSYAPSLPDQSYYSYAAGVGANNNALGSFNTASTNGSLPRGAFPLDQYNVQHYGVAAGVSTLIDSSTIAVGTTNDDAADGEYWIINVVAIITEPIFVSPFTWSNPEHNSQGLLGINNMAMNFTIDSLLPRLLSTGSEYSQYYSIVAGDARAAPSNSASNFFLSSRVLLKFLSTQDTDRLQTKNVVPFMDFPRYVTSQFNNGSSITANGGTATAVSNNIQLNQLPDYFIICVRKQMNSLTITDSDSFLKIKTATFNLNNMSGLLSTATPQDLWKISSKNGSNQSWLEFNGRAWVNADPAEDTITGTNIATTGSLLVVSPTDLSLPSYLAPGSLGNFQLSITLSVENQSATDVTAEIVVVAVNSGFMVTQMGQSSVYTGVLTREAVLDAKMTKPVSSAQYERKVGGKLLNRVCSAVMDRPMPMRKIGGAEMSAGSRLSGLY
jgi:hypothetical protein